MSIRSMYRTALLGAVFSLPIGTAFAQDPTPVPTPDAPPPVDAPAAPTTPGGVPPAAAPAMPATPTAAEMDQKLTGLFGESEPYRAFLVDLKAKAADGDMKELAKLVSYPFKTKIDDKETTIENEKAMAKMAGDVFTPSVLAAIKAQTYETLFANQMGVMIGSGDVWFTFSGEGAEKAVKIFAVNQVPPAG